MADLAPVLAWKAIAAMSENRAIGFRNGIPWHLPEDFRWFRQCTTGRFLVLGRKTFQGLKGPLPNRINLVLTRDPAKVQKEHPDVFGNASLSSGALSYRNAGELALPGFPFVDVRLIGSLDVIKRHFPRDVFIGGGASVYEQALPDCAELLLTRVKRTVDGDAFFPPFEHLFELTEVIRDTPEFTIERWRRRVQ